MNINKYQELIKNERMNKAVVVASELYMEKGIQNVKMTDVAKMSDMGVASLYRYFGTKKAFTIEVAVYTWNNLLNIYNFIISEKVFNELSGYEQIKSLLNVYKIVLKEYGKFFTFIADFDNYVTNEVISKDELCELNETIYKFYNYYKKAIETGIKDGTIDPNIDIDRIYFTSTHSMNALCQKIIGPNIISLDEMDDVNEVDVLISMILNYIIY